MTKEDVRKFDAFIQSSWKDGNTGLGYDAKGLTHDGIKVKKVIRYKNPSTLENYKDTKKIFIERLKGDRNVFVVPPNVREHLDPVLHRKFLPPGEPRLDLRINEVWLFHGTKFENVPSIQEEGLDYEAAGDGLYGKWIYLTDSPQKADQYAGECSANNKQVANK